MKVFVTGGTGFVGGHLIAALRERGDEVIALARSAPKAAIVERLGARSVIGDLDDREALRRCVEGVDTVFHVAGVVAARDEAAYLRANRDGTTHVVEAAGEAGSPRLVFVSSLAAAGPAEPGKPLAADADPRPVTAYGRSKLAGEAIVRASTLPWVIVRPPMVYGPGDREVLRLFQAAARGIVPVFGKGDQELSAIYGPDLAQALIAVAVATSAAGRTYHACHESVFRSAELAREVGRAVGRDVKILRLPGGVVRGVLTLTGAWARLTRRTTVLNRDKANEFLQPAWTGDPAPLTRDTGWRAAHDLPAGLAATARWYRDEGWL